MNGRHSYNINVLNAIWPHTAQNLVKETIGNVVVIHLTVALSTE